MLCEISLSCFIYACTLSENDEIKMWYINSWLMPSTFPYPLVLFRDRWGNVSYEPWLRWVNHKTQHVAISVDGLCVFMYLCIQRLITLHSNSCCESMVKRFHTLCSWVVLTNWGYLDIVCKITLILLMNMMIPHPHAMNIIITSPLIEPLPLGWYSKLDFVCRVIRISCRDY